MNNYDMVASPGRTYRYYRGKPLFEFGAGLSLTTFSLAASCVKADPGRARGRGSIPKPPCGGLNSKTATWIRFK